MRTQRGITLIGFVFTLVIGGFFALIAMRLVPSYIEYSGVVKSMEQLKADSSAANKSLEEIRRDLSLKFSLQYVDDKTIAPQNIQLSRQGGAVTLRVVYDKRVPFLYNVDFLISFDKSINLSPGSSR